jgi:beta-glucosidase
MGYEFYPQALENVIRLAWQETQVPVIVTENGLATSDDTRRVEFIRQALAGVRIACRMIFRSRATSTGR